MVRGDFNDEVLEALGEGVGPSPPAYLQLLRPSRGERGGRVLANLEAISNRLQDRPECWVNLIRARDWRHVLAGCSAVLLVREGRFFGDLLARFRQGSWVAPQLAVALGVVHPAEAVMELERVIRQGGSPADVKSTFSAYAVLKLMGRAAGHEFEASDLFLGCQAESPGTSAAANASRVALEAVQSQWEFWTNQHAR